MAEQLSNSRICRNGHQQPHANSKFCIYCGVSLAVSAPQQNNQIPSNNQNPNAIQPQQQNFQQPIQPQNNQRQQNQQPNQNLNNQQQNLQNQQNFQQPQQQNFNNQQQQFNNPQQQNFAQPQNQQQNFVQQNNQLQNFVQQNNQQQFYQQQPPPQQYVAPPSCYTCGGNGEKLDPKAVICKECSWLKPLVPGYRIDSTAFEWAADAKAMATLRAMTPLTAAAKMVSEKVGRRWIESTFNGILLGEKQMPHIYSQAVKAARILGLTHMPDVYLSGERPWDCLTFGTEKDSFIVIGSAIAGNFQSHDLFFLLAREMGHCQAGHALWKSVIRFLIGEQSQAKGFMAGGIMNAIKSPGQLIVNAVEVPLLAWARQAEITADRAALLCIGSEEVARRVLISWSLRSSMLFKQINIKAWLEQQATSEEDGYSKLSELTTSSTPYLSRRLKLLSDFAKSPELEHWRKLITEAIRRSSPPKPAEQPKQLQTPTETKKKSDFIGIKCAECKTAMKVPLKILQGKDELPVKCPNEKCGKVTRLKKSVKTIKANTKKQEENLNYGD